MAKANEPERSFATSNASAIRSEIERIVLSLGDAELAMWVNLFGDCPHRLLKRRYDALQRKPGGANGPIRAPFTGREAEIAASARHEFELKWQTYAIENLIGRRLPVRKTA